MRLKKNILLFSLFLLFSFSLTAFSFTSAIKNDNSLPTLSDEEKTDISNYLSQNKGSMNIYGDLSAFSILNKDIADKDMFLIGEYHHVGWNREVELELLKYLNKEFGVRYLLPELSYSLAQLFNIYLNTGDSAILDFRAETYPYTKDENKFWKDLYKYNKTLPQDKKIIVVGTDIESSFDPVFAFYYLRRLLPKNEPPKEIKDNIEMLKKGDLMDYNCLIFYEDLNKHKNAYKAYFKNKYFDFEQVNKNLYNDSVARKTKGQYGNIREKYIIENFKELYSRLPKGKYYGYWGRDHISQHKRSTGFMNCDQIACVLQNGDTPVKGKVISIAISYKDCSVMDYFDKCDFKPIPCDEAYDLSLFEPYIDKDINMFKLNNTNSPFTNKLCIVDSALGGITTDYFQYLLILKNSPASQRWDLKNPD